jgi:acyl carrier protein
MSLTDELIQFIQETLVDDPGVTVDEESRLIDTGLVDSMGLEQVIHFVERRAGVRLSDDDVVPENFQTVAAIEGLVERLRGGA